MAETMDLLMHLYVGLLQKSAPLGSVIPLRLKKTAKTKPKLERGGASKVVCVYVCVCEKCVCACVCVCV